MKSSVLFRLLASGCLRSTGVSLRIQRFVLEPQPKNGGCALQERVLISWITTHQVFCQCFLAGTLTVPMTLGIPMGSASLLKGKEVHFKGHQRRCCSCSCRGAPCRGSPPPKQIPLGVRNKYGRRVSK